MSRLLCLLLIPAVIAVPSNIVRPCDVRDYDCIGKNLATNSECNPNVWGVIPPSYTIPSFYYYGATFNSSYIETNLTIRNHNNCAVSDFFFNLATDNCVLAIRCPWLEFEAERLLIQHTVEAEDRFYSYDFWGAYPQVIITVNLRPANAIELCKVPAFAYVSALPNFKVNPKDQKTKNFLTTDLSLLNIYERETFHYRANELIRYFINAMICNFGCDF